MPSSLQWEPLVSKAVGREAGTSARRQAAWHGFRNCTHALWATPGRSARSYNLLRECSRSIVIGDRQ